jgi:hypothetical protein
MKRSHGMFHKYFTPSNSDYLDWAIGTHAISNLRQLLSHISNGTLYAVIPEETICHGLTVVMSARVNGKSWGVFTVFKECPQVGDLTGGKLIVIYGWEFVALY